MLSKAFGGSRVCLLGIAFVFTALLSNQSVGMGETDLDVGRLNIEARDMATRDEFKRAAFYLDWCGQQGRIRTVGWDELERICTDAQKKVNECKAYLDDFDSRRWGVLSRHPKEGLALTDRIVVKDDTGNPLLDPKTGKPITEARSFMRGEGPQPDQEQRNNDYVYLLRNAHFPDCPSTVPGVSRDGYSLTPLEALRFWKEQDSKPLPGAVLQRRTSGSSSTLLAAAVSQANEEGVIRDAEEEAAEKERQRLAKIKAEQDRLAQIEADRQAKERARQLALQQAEDDRQAKVAARAARTSSGSSGSSGAPSASSRSVGGKSICVRNYDKYVEDYTANNIKIYAATGDLFYAQIWGAMSKLFEPCLSFDQESRTNHTQLQKLIGEYESFCSAPHEDWQCQQWGAPSSGHTEDHQRALAWVQSEVSQLLATSGSQDRSGAPTSAKVSGADGSLDLSRDSSGDDRSRQLSAACADGMDRLTDEGNAINSRRPADASTVATIQVGLYIIDRSLKFLDSSCKGQPEYRQYADLKRAYDQTMTTCGQIASSTSYCVPKLAW
ncbi:MAG: hypothetical protein NT117_01185 [Gammaproteobacteria bacterium]|nr:hypothetical protein [Gammaproteobacteria bacterium]